MYHVTRAKCLISRRAARDRIKKQGGNLNVLLRSLANTMTSSLTSSQVPLGNLYGSRAGLVRSSLFLNVRCFLMRDLLYGLLAVVPPSLPRVGDIDVDLKK